jgi:hypothetical protein
MSKELTKNIGELNGSVKSYMQAKIDLVKLTLLERLSRFTAYLFNVVIIIMFSILILGFAATAFALWYGKTFNNYLEGVLIAGGCLIIAALIFWLFRKKIVTNSVISNFSEILFEEQEAQK